MFIINIFLNCFFAFDYTEHGNSEKENYKKVAEEVMKKFLFNFQKLTKSKVFYPLIFASMSFIIYLSRYIVYEILFIYGNNTFVNFLLPLIAKDIGKKQNANGEVYYKSSPIAIALDNDRTDIAKKILDNAPELRGLSFHNNETHCNLQEYTLKRIPISVERVANISKLSPLRKERRIIARYYNLLKYINLDDKLNYLDIPTKIDKEKTKLSDDDQYRIKRIFAIDIFALLRRELRKNSF